MRAFIVITLFGLLPQTHVAVDEVDLVEVNHFYDAEGRLVYDQVIFWRWCDCVSEYRVTDWRFLKSPYQTPNRDWERGRFQAVWHDGKMLRQVRSRLLRETWTQFDPELHDRQFLPQAQRAGLLRDYAQNATVHSPDSPVRRGTPE